jgi:membrane protein DedA with SNARE-associated domain
MSQSPSPTDPGAARRIRLTPIGAALLVLLLVASMASVAFAMRTYASFLFLRSAQELGLPDASHVRGWMTLGYLAETFEVPEAALIEELGLAPGQDSRTNLREIAHERRIPTFDYVLAVQAALAEITSTDTDEAPAPAEGGWLTALGDWFLSAVLLYGYPALSLTLFVGAVGLPVPTGLSTVVAGSLASDGHLSGGWAFLAVVAASVAGDAAGYGLGRFLNERVLERRGRWLGLTPANRTRVEAMFARWGALTIVLTRTLVSHLSSVVSLLAGMSRYRFASFVLFAVLGRIVWTAAYLGLGYSVGTSFEAASIFLTNLSGLLLSLALAAAAAILLLRRV